MELMPMKYKDYVWPHNPKVYGITYKRVVAAEKVPFGRYVMRDMGLSYRVLSGEGEFCGEGAYDEFKKLATVFYDNGPGALWHPLWTESNAYFTALALRQEPTPDYVSYTFEFREAYDGYESAVRTVTAAAPVTAGAVSAARTHTVVPGDTMWAIARANGMTLAELVKLNPQIKNPNLIRTGETVYIS